MEVGKASVANGKSQDKLTLLKQWRVSRGLLILLIACSSQSHADDAFYGGTLTAGPVIGNNSGQFFDATIYGGLGVWLFLGAEAKELNDSSLNAIYAGMGILSFLQLHAGWSNDGAIYRIKSEISPFSLMKKSIFADPSDGATSLKRWSISIIYENGFAKSELENVSIGLGYTFN